MNKFDTERLRSLLEASKFKRDYVAREACIKTTSLCHIIGGRHNPSAATTKLLAMTLGTTVDYLLGNTDNPGTERTA
jgi:transcriptional regulator with XRE-family HTH domain